MLLGFTRLNSAHNGKRLGQALFKVLTRLGIEDKVRIFLLSPGWLVLNILNVGWVYYVRQC